MWKTLKTRLKAAENIGNSMWKAFKRMLKTFYSAFLFNYLEK